MLWRWCRTHSSHPSHLHNKWERHLTNKWNREQRKGGGVSERDREKEMGHGVVTATARLSAFDLQISSLCHQFREQGKAITLTRGLKQKTAPQCYLTALLIILQWKKRSQIGLISLYIKQESRYKDRGEVRGVLEEQRKWTERIASTISPCSLLYFFFYICTAQVIISNTMYITVLVAGLP